jgi:hypothetical protein
MEAVRQVLLRKRKDRVQIPKLTDKQKEEVPPIALIGSFRKYTS